MYFKPLPTGLLRNRICLPLNRHCRLAFHFVAINQSIATMLQKLGLVALLLFSSLLGPASAVKRGDFKTCSQSGFCRRLRDLPVTTGRTSSSPYAIDVDSAHYESATGLFSARINSAIYPEAHFQLSIGVTAEGLARIKVDEVNGLRQRYNETAKWTLLQEPSLSTSTAFDADSNGKGATLTWHVATPSGTKSTRQARITFSPLKLEFIRDGEVHVSFNEQNLFHMEHFRVKRVGDEPQDPPDIVIDEAISTARKQFEPFMSEDGAWEESFGGHTDSKPKGMPQVLMLRQRCTLTVRIDTTRSRSILFRYYVSRLPTRLWHSSACQSSVAADDEVGSTTFYLFTVTTC